MPPRDGVSVAEQGRRRASREAADGQPGGGAGTKGTPQRVSVPRDVARRGARRRRRRRGPGVVRASAGEGAFAEAGRRRCFLRERVPGPPGWEVRRRDRAVRGGGDRRGGGGTPRRPDAHVRHDFVSDSGPPGLRGGVAAGVPGGHRDGRERPGVCVPERAKRARGERRRRGREGGGTAETRGAVFGIRAEKAPGARFLRRVRPRRALAVRVSVQRARRERRRNRGSARRRNRRCRNRRV